MRKNDLIQLFWEYNDRNTASWIGFLQSNDNYCLPGTHELQDDLGSPKKDLPSGTPSSATELECMYGLKATLDSDWWWDLRLRWLLWPDTLLNFWKKGVLKVKL